MNNTHYTFFVIYKLSKNERKPNVKYLLQTFGFLLLFLLRIRMSLLDKINCECVQSAFITF